MAATALAVAPRPGTHPPGWRVAFHHLGETGPAHRHSGVSGAGCPVLPRRLADEGEQEAVPALAADGLDGRRGQPRLVVDEAQ